MTEIDRDVSSPEEESDRTSKGTHGRKHRKSDRHRGPERKAETSEKGQNAGPEESATVAEKAGSADTREHDDRLLRLQADFENFRKRMTREREETFRRANEDLIGELLPVLDHHELALEAAEKHQADASIVEGFRLVYEQLLSVLGKFGVKPIDATGDIFDPHKHEAISHIVSEDVPENMIVHQTRKGYELGRKLLRPAQVVVSSGPPEAAAMDDAGSSREE